MTRSTEIEIKVGLFVTIGAGLLMMTILLLGGGQSVFQRSVVYHTRFPQIEGLVEGATVKLAGIRVGQVSEVKFLADSGVVDVSFTVFRKYKEAIRKDTTVGIQTQGMLGDRYLIISTSSGDAPIADENSELKSEAPRELKDYLSGADEVISRLKNSLGHIDSILGSARKDGRSDTLFKNLAVLSTNLNEGTKNMKESMERARSIMAKIDNGNGTLGALINDPSLYDDLKALLGGANRSRVLKYFIKKSVEESREASKKQADVSKSP